MKTRLQKISFSFLCLVTIFASPSLFAGWGSGGGSGVACFKRVEDAKQADVYLNQKKNIPRALKDRIESLVTLEYWENYPPSTPFVQSDSREKILSLIRERLQKYSPLFYFRYELVKDRIDFAQWKENAELPVIEDRTTLQPVEKTHPHCRIVQLVVRWARSTAGKVPEVRVEFDSTLFGKLDAFNQAMLQVHEEFYLLGKETPEIHVSSDTLRTHVAILLSERFWKLVGDMPTPASASRKVQLLLNMIFGDYFLFFMDDESEKPSAIPSGYNQYSRFESFKSVLVRVRARKQECMQRRTDLDLLPPIEKNEVLNACSFEALDPLRLSDSLTDEEAFVYMSRWILDYFEHIDNSENLMVWNRKNPGEVTSAQRKELRHACQQLREDRYPRFYEANEKAVRYCVSLGL